MAPLHDTRIEKVLMQVIDVFRDAPLERPADADVVEDGFVLHVLAQADAASVRADWNSEFRSEQEHSHDFVHAAQPTRVDLAE